MRVEHLIARLRRGLRQVDKWGQLLRHAQAIRRLTAKVQVSDGQLRAWLRVEVRDHSARTAVDIHLAGLATRVED